MRKTIYIGKLPTSKRRTRKSFWVFFLNTTTNYTRKKNQKEARNIFFDFLEVFQTRKKKGENKLNMDDTMKKSGHRQLE